MITITIIYYLYSPIYVYRSIDNNINNNNSNNKTLDIFNSKTLHILYIKKK